MYSTMGRQVPGNVYRKEKQSKRDKEGALECFLSKRPQRTRAKTELENMLRRREALASQLNNKTDYIVYGVKGPSWFGLLEYLIT